MHSPLTIAPIETPECWRLLRSAQLHLGRVAITSGARPIILPVFYTVVDEAVAFRTVAGTKLQAATSGTVVAFEVDWFDPAINNGWSVVIQGVEREVTDAVERDRLRALLDRILMIDGATADSFVIVTATKISGRVIKRATPAV